MFFQSLYDRVISWSKHPKAVWYLGGLSLAESSFFPIPPDIMLLPMALAKPKSAWFLALLTTITSVIGGVIGYLIGYFSIDLILPILEKLHYISRYQQVQLWFADWGIWVIFLAGFSPIPYKLFTISAGAISMSFLPFVLASLVGRGARFFLVSAIVVMAGAKAEIWLREHIDKVAWSVLLLAAIAYAFYHYLH